MTEEEGQEETGLESLTDDELEKLARQERKKEMDETALKDHIRALREELKDELSQTRASDKQEREELKAHIAKLTETLADMKAAQDKKGEAKSESTIVVPPSFLSQPVAHSNEPTTNEQGTETATVKPKGWKTWW